MKKKKTIDNDFANGLVLLKQRLDIKERKIAEICGVSESLVYNWIAKKCMPTYQTLQKLHSYGMRDYEMFGNDNLIEKNYNQIVYIEELSYHLKAEIPKAELFRIKSGYYDLFNDLNNNEKLAFLLNVITSHLEFIDEINTSVKQLIEKTETKETK